MQIVLLGPDAVVITTERLDGFDNCTKNAQQFYQIVPFVD